MLTFQAGSTIAKGLEFFITEKNSCFINYLLSIIYNHYFSIISNDIET